MRTAISSNNRVVLAAMTNKQSHSDGLISKNEIKWLSRRAKDGFGIITTAAANISVDGKGWEGEIGVFNDKQISGLKILTSNIRYYGSLSIAQLFHGGMRSPESLTGVTPISASKNSCIESESGFSKACSENDIVRLIQDFSDAANRCVESGFDGIELHGAHGYLISQFLGSKSNRRTDKWGGNIAARSRFLIEIYHSIKKQVPESFLVGVRISPEIDNLGIRLEDSIKLVKILTDQGVDFIHISCWDVFSRSIEYPNNPKTLTEWFTESVSNLPAIISTGGVWSAKDAQDVLKQGPDLIGVGRVGIAYPDWAKNLSNIHYAPLLPPFSYKHLKNADLSDPFIDYMRKWDGFVSK